MLCWFLPHVSMKQPRVYVCPLPPSHLPPDTTPHGCHGAPGWAPCVIQQTPAVCVTRGDVYVSEPPASYSRRPLSALHVVTCVFPASYSRRPLSALHVVTCMFLSPLHHTANARCLCYTWWHVCFTASLLICPSLSCCCVHTSVLPGCVSTAALQIGSSRPFSRFHIFFTVIYIKYVCIIYVIKSFIQIFNLTRRHICVCVCVCVCVCMCLCVCVRLLLGSLANYFTRVSFKLQFYQ